MNKEKYEKILNAAEKLFNRFGIKKTAIDEIAELADVAKGTIYNNFGTKEKLFKALIDKKISEFEFFVNKTAKELQDPIGQLQFILKERIKMLKDNPMLFDKALGVKEKQLKDFRQKLDFLSKQILQKVVERSFTRNFSIQDKNQVIDTILFTLSGIEQKIRDSIDTISIKDFDKDIDFIIKLIFKQNNQINPG